MLCTTWSAGIWEVKPLSPGDGNRMYPHVVMELFERF